MSWVSLTFANQGKAAQCLLYFLKAEHLVLYPSRSTSEFYPSGIRMLPCSQDLCEQEAEHSQGF